MTVAGYPARSSVMAHVDGLRDPRGYLDQLRRAVGPGTYVVDFGQNLAGVLRLLAFGGVVLVMAVGFTLLFLTLHIASMRTEIYRRRVAAMLVDIKEQARGRWELVDALTDRLSAGGGDYDGLDGGSGPDTLDGEFDIVFTSYGALNWLPDLSRWAARPATRPSRRPCSPPRAPAAAPLSDS